MRQKSNVDYNEILKREAIKRMELLEIDSDVTEMYARKNKIMVSQRGTIRELKHKEKLLIREHEAKTGNKVFHVISTDTSYSDLIELLSVSPHKEEWVSERRRLKKYSEISCMVYNLTIPEYSEFGRIWVTNIKGCLFRTA